MNRRFNRRLPCLWLGGMAVCIGLAGCATPKPEAEILPITVPARFAGNAELERWVPGRLAEFSAPAQWWSVFADPELDRWLQQAEAHSPGLQIAVARYRAAKAVWRETGSAQHPHLDASLAASRSQNSGDTSGNRLSLGAEVSWELDLWGRLQAATDQARALRDAAQADVAAARLSLQAQVAETYFTLRALQARHALLVEQVAADTRLQALTRERYAAGMVARLDVLQIESRLASSQAEHAATARELATTRTALRTLLGDVSQTLPVADVALPGTLRVAVPAAPRLLPSRVVEQRPDILAAQQRLAAANAAIGAARAAYFPNLTLAADAGLRGTSLAALANDPTRFWSFGPLLALSVLDAGKRTAVVEQRQAERDIAAAAYRQTVLEVFGEVETSLVSLRWLSEQAQSLTTALTAAREALSLAEARYAAGTISRLEVVEAQKLVYSAEAAAVEVWRQRMLATLRLLKQLGGYWPEPASGEIPKT